MIDDTFINGFEKTAASRFAKNLAKSLGGTPKSLSNNPLYKNMIEGSKRTLTKGGRTSKGRYLHAQEYINSAAKRGELKQARQRYKRWNKTLKMDHKTNFNRKKKLAKIRPDKARGQAILGMKKAKGEKLYG